MFETLHDTTIGMVLCAGAGIFNAIGYILQKSSITANSKLPIFEQRHVWGQTLWNVGWGCFNVGNTVAVAALYFGPLTVIGPLTVGLTLLANTILSPMFVEAYYTNPREGDISGIQQLSCCEEISLVSTEIYHSVKFRLQAIGVIFIGVGCLLIILYGSAYDVSSYTVDNLAYQLSTQQALTYNCVLLVFLFISTVWSSHHTAIVMPLKRETFDGRLNSTSKKVICFIDGVTAGCFISGNIVLLKTIIEAFDDSQCFQHWFFWILIFGAIVIHYVQTNFIDKAMESFAARDVLPLILVSCVFFTSLSGIIIYQDFENSQMTAKEIVLYVLGIVFIMIGVYISAAQESYDLPQADRWKIAIQKLRYQLRSVRRVYKVLRDEHGHPLIRSSSDPLVPQQPFRLNSQMYNFISVPKFTLLPYCIWVTTSMKLHRPKEKRNRKKALAETIANDLRATKSNQPEDLPRSSSVGLYTKYEEGDYPLNSIPASHENSKQIEGKHKEEEPNFTPRTTKLYGMDLLKRGDELLAKVPASTAVY